MRFKSSLFMQTWRRSRQPNPTSATSYTSAHRPGENRVTNPPNDIMRWLKYTVAPLHPPAGVCGQVHVSLLQEYHRIPPHPKVGNYLTLQPWMFNEAKMAHFIREGVEDPHSGGIPCTSRPCNNSCITPYLSRAPWKVLAHQYCLYCRPLALP